MGTFRASEGFRRGEGLLFSLYIYELLLGEFKI
jgi:hypothetical protein